MNPSTDLPASASDLDLLQHFEPVLRFTRGEAFFPTDVERYIQESSLWAHTPDGRDELLVPQGELTVETLIRPRLARFGTVYYLRFIEALSLSEAARALTDQTRLRRKLKNHFHPGLGRLARGGFLPRVVDALFTFSFFLRGRVPAAIAAAAELAYFRLRRRSDKYIYYGRVVRQDGWIILQYWFFYCYNNWRSGFNGVNDHEADWELITVYAYEQNGFIVPEWAAYASHDFQGNDLRRRWDDDEQLDLVDGHPVVYVGAGSHASYFQPGEYQAEVNLSLPTWVRNARKVWNRFWTETLGQQPLDPFRIPFVDYARGDGLSIGPGQAEAWTPVLIDESTPWGSQYRGLWGLYARDPISGENAPAGPMYNRDGSPRNAWYNPLGFAGLDKVPPPPAALRLLTLNCERIADRQRELETQIPTKTLELQSLGMRLKGMEGNSHLVRQYAALEKRIQSLAGEVQNLRREHFENAAVLQGLTQRLEQLRLGLKDDARAHLSRLAMPVETAQVRFARAAETWAAISLSLLLYGVVALVFVAPQHLWASLAAISILFVVIESILRGAFVQTVSVITTLLALLATFILFLHFWRWILLALLLGVATFLLLQRLRELAG